MGLFKVLGTIGAGVLMAPSFCLANSNTFVQSSHSRQNVFRVVSANDSSKDTTDKPGIYLVQAKETARPPLVLGQVLDVSSSFNGILTQLDLARRTRRDESLAIVNGRLTLFSNRSTPLSKKSYVTFGEEMQIVDAVTQRPFRLEAIKSVDDVRVQTFTDVENRSGELVLISLRQPNPMGTGLTFAFMVDLERDGSKSTELRLRTPPLIIDYDFLGADALERLRESCTMTDCVLSRSHLLNLSQRQPSDDRILKHWREAMERMAQEIKLGSKVKTSLIDQPHAAVGGLEFVPPRLSLTSGGLSIPQLPTQVVAQAPFQISQRIDPLGTRSGISVRRPNVDMTEVMAEPIDIQGQIEFNTKTGRYRVHDLLSYGPGKTAFADDSTALTSESLVVAEAGNTPWIFMKRTTEYDVIRASLDGVNLRDCKKLAGHHAHAIVKGADETHIVLISYERTARDKGTWAFQFTARSPLGRQIARVKISDEFWDPVQLKTRTWLTRDQVLFDSISEYPVSQGQASVPKELERSGQIRNGVPTNAFVDVMESLTNDSVAQFYLTFQSEKRVDSRLMYREYNDKGAITPWTGFYVLRQDDWPETLTSARDSRAGFSLDGRLLKKGDESDGEAERSVISSKLFEGELPVAQISAVPFTSSKAKSTNSFRLLLYLNGLKRDHSEMEEAIPSLETVEVPFSFESFVGGQIIQGRRKASNEATLLLFSNESSGGGVYALPLKLSRRNDGRHVHLTLAIDNVSRIFKGEFNTNHLRSRIAFDHEGSPYWVDLPDLDHFDSKYSVRSLSKSPEVTIYTNRPGFRQILRYDESFEGSGGFYANGDSFWKVYTTRDLTKRYKGLSEYMAQQGAAIAKAGKTPEPIFPELLSFLNHLAGDGPKQQQVILIEKDLKPQILKEVLTRFVENQDGNWSLENSSVALHDYNASASPETTLKELERIGRRSNRRDILFVDLAEIADVDDRDPPLTMKRTQSLEQEDDSKEGSETKIGSDAKNEDEVEETEVPAKIGTSDSGEVDENRFTYSRLAYLSLEGRRPHLESATNTSSKPRYQTLILATPEEWRRQMESYPKEAKAGFFAGFKVDARFLTSSWTVWPPNSVRASDKIKRVSREPISKDEFSIFKGLDKMLSELADPKGTTSQRILVVPEEIKSYISSLIMTRWASNSKEMGGAWSYKNSNLSLYELSAADGVTQESILDNFQSMRGALTNRRPVLLADMANVIKLGRPPGRSEDKTFRLRDPILSGQNNSSLIEGLNGESTQEELDRRAIPHAIWWLASEGRKIQPKKDRDWSLKAEAAPDIPVLILATEKELDTLGQVTAFESRFFSLKKHFEIVHLEKPSQEAKVALVNDLFNRADIQSLSYEFHHENLAGDEARRQLLGLFVGRIDQIARNLKIEPTDAFTRTFVALKRALTEDSELRQSRRFDRFYLERLYTKVFPLPLNYEVLEPGDFLSRFKDPNRAARGLTDAGYEGALELKERVARNVTAQTKGVNDNGMRVPSSQILFGDTSTGKTFLIETIIKHAGFKLYDYDRPSDEEAQAMIIKVQEIAENKDKAKAGQVSIDEVLEHISNFLAMPRGSRGLILFDDLHKAQTKVVWQKLKTFIESLFDARDGLITVKRMGEKYAPVKVPVRNLILNATVNPQDDGMVRRKYVKEDNDIVGEVMAALNKPDYDPIDRSHFARWTDIIDLRKFPRDAKVPTLLRDLREANAQSYAAKPNLVLVTSRTMDEMGTGFEDANAREFLNPATYALLDAPNHLPKAPIYIIDRQKLNPAEVEPKSVRTRLKAADVESFVKEKTVQYAISEKNPTSKLHLLSLMIDNFRAQVYSGLVLAAQSNPKLSDTEELRKSEMMSFLLASLHTIEEFPAVPLKDVAMRPSDFHLLDLESVAAFEEDVARLSVKTPGPFLRVEIQGSADDFELNLTSFIGGRTDKGQARRRVDVMVETAHEIEVALTPVFAKFFRVPDLRLTQTPREWLLSLRDSDARDNFKEVSQQLVEVYTRFQAQLYDADLEEMRHSDQYVPMNIYDRSRLFLLCLDRALTRLPWGHISQFMIEVMELASSDLTLSQRAEFQDFLFKARFSPFNTVTPDTVVSLANAMSLVKSANEAKGDRYRSRYNDNCEKFLVRPEEGPK